jgi:hypothetical protein
MYPASVVALATFAGIAAFGINDVYAAPSRAKAVSGYGGNASGGSIHYEDASQHCCDLLSSLLGITWDGCSSSLLALLSSK